MNNIELILKAKSVIKTRKFGEFTAGDVGAALLTSSGNVYTGVCIDAPSGMGFCAEHSAIAAMVTAGESHIVKAVAVWMENDDIHILTPCGRCREFMRFIDNRNLEADIIIDKDKTTKLRELLPLHDWFHKIDI